MSSPAMSTPASASRPRTVAIAFWCWLVASVLTAAQGMWVVSQPVPLFFLVTGGILIVVGLAQGYLAGRARRGHKRFANAAVALALASVVIFALLLLVGGGGVITLGVIMILLIVGSVMIQRQPSQEWFENRATT